MTRKWFAVALLAAMLASIALAAILLPRLLQPALAQLVTRASGMDVAWEGAPRLGFFPDPHLSVNRLTLRNQDAPVAQVETLHASVALRPLLRGELQVRELRLTRPALTIEKLSDGRYNFTPAGASPSEGRAFKLDQLSISEGRITYLDRQSGDRLRANDCAFEAQDIQLPRTGSAKSGEQTSAGELSCAELQISDYPGLSDIHASAHLQAGELELDPLTLQIFGGQGSGRLQINRREPTPRYQLSYAVSQLRSEQLLTALGRPGLAEGPVDLTAVISVTGSDRQSLRQSLEGTVSLRGRNLRLHGTDLDERLARYESSQNFSLMDAGIFFIAGPFGVAATKGYELAGAARQTGGGSRLRALVSNWILMRGIATATDVAMATDQHRIALKGKLNFVTEQFDGVSLAVVDDKGCPKLRQTVGGTFSKPIVSKPDAVSSLTGPVASLFKKARDAFPGTSCEIFYAGSIPAPN